MTVFVEYSHASGAALPRDAPDRKNAAYVSYRSDNAPETLILR